MTVLGNLVQHRALCHHHTRDEGCLGDTETGDNVPGQEEGVISIRGIMESVSCPGDGAKVVL